NQRRRETPADELLEEAPAGLRRVGRRPAGEYPPDGFTLVVGREGFQGLAGNLFRDAARLQFTGDAPGASALESAGLANVSFGGAAVVDNAGSDEPAHGRVDVIAFEASPGQPLGQFGGRVVATPEQPQRDNARRTHGGVALLQLP